VKILISLLCSFVICLGQACWRYSVIRYGIEKSTFEIARNLKKMGLSVSQIADGTGLLPEVVEKL
jgi:hypothetical protein